MTIIFHRSSREFHLFNDHISYLIKVLENDQLGQLYFGARVDDADDHSYLVENTYRPVTAYVSKDDYSFSLANVRQEYPAYGTSDFRLPALELAQEDGSTVTNFTYKDYRIIKGKPKLPGLPATYVEDDRDAETLVITLTDEKLAIDLELSYTIFANLAVIARNARFINHGTTSPQLTRALSLNLDLLDADYDWLQFSGAWGRERQVKATHLRQGEQSVSSTRGASGHMENPFVILKRPHTDDFQGEALAVSLVYSGNFLAQAEVDPYQVTRLQIGINPFHFSWQLAPGESFQTPEALLAYSATGLNVLSQSFHRLYSKHLVRGEWRDRPRPVLVNNWEATYFNFTEEKLLAIADRAKEIGAELFVLDDGWFGKRTFETAGLGDWWPNPAQLPHGIAGLSQQIHARGLKFGLWFEPEMANLDSDLYRNHPDFLLKTPGRRMSQGRRQYVLDFARPEVVDYIHDLMAKVLREGQVDYVKWDMNRNITECYSAAFPPAQQGEIFHRYILGVYSLYERLIQEFPHILFESCASGGGRFDAGMLYYAPQAWTSDDSDAAMRLLIQTGTSYGYPLSSMGAHVSAVPNEQVHRVTPLNTRGNVAFFGDLGYELDLTSLSKEELAQIKEQISFYKRYREVFQHGTFYRVQNPFAGDPNWVGWLVVSPDQRTALYADFKFLNDMNAPYRRQVLPGLAPDLTYRVEEVGKGTVGDFSGRDLAHIGLVTSDAASGVEEATTDFASRLYLLEGSRA